MMLVVLILVALAAVAFVLERAGAPTTLELSFRGDVKRETGWLAQYGQGACTVAVALVIWRLDRTHEKELVALLVAVFGGSLVATIIKRLVGRVRPRRPQAGTFLGPTLHHDNARESFPSSHSAAAIALSAALSAMYPAGAPVFWTLGILCAALRYVLDAHWPSDVLAGVALGIASTHLTWRAFGLLGGV